MKAQLLLAVAALAVVACGQGASPTPATSTAADASALTLSCADFAGATPTTLTERFGAENVTTQTMPGPEGESYEATLVYANDPTRRLELTWTEDHSALASAMVSTVGTQWRGAEGYTIGTPIADIERLNVMPFKLWGFDWDYGGRVSDWNVGTFSQSLVPGCTVRMRFDPRSQTNTSSASGDSEFASNDPAMRAADPAVAAFGLLFGSADPE
ncbi:MAG: hypothetical protein IPG56_03285 [Caulobacteraceae bacterium]|nr:hypothetical protein [Caulobacteraceae bacterium]